MEILKLQTLTKKVRPFTALLYCPPGVGKTTALGLLAERAEGGKTLIIDVDRTVTTALSKGAVVKNIDNIDIIQIDIYHAWDSWSALLVQLDEWAKQGKLDGYYNICVDNISELERCILSDLGNKGKNKGVPAQADYQYMQFKLVNSLRFLKSLNVNVVLTAWETVEQFTNPDGSSFSRVYPKCNSKIVDNICGLCDIVGKIVAKPDGTRGIVLEATQNIYAKNQYDNRKGCLVEDFIKWNFNK